MMLRLGQSLRISQSLQLRETMEIFLYQSLCITQKLRLILALYMKREGELTRLYRRALDKGLVKLYDKHGMKFEFALVSKDDLPECVKSCGMAFSHCVFKGFDALLFGQKYAVARGSWLLFVVYDMYPGIPESYIEYAAVHERGEQVTLGDHNLASKLEFSIAKIENNLVKYMTWIEEESPVKFADIFNYQTHLELPDSEEFRKDLETFTSFEEAEVVKGMIERFEWPFSLLQKLTLYKKRSDEVVEIAGQAMRTAEILVGEAGIPLVELIARVRDEVIGQLRLITKRQLGHYINFPYMEIFWWERRMRVDREFLKMLDLRKRISPDYDQEIIEADIASGLPRDNVLSFSFAEALRAL